MSNEVKPDLKQFAVWQIDNPEDGGVWMLYNTMEEAVSEHGAGTEVFSADFKSLGMYELSVQRAIKVKTKKKRVRAKKEIAE